MNPIDEIMSKFPHESLQRRMCIASGISEWELPIVVSELLGAGSKEILDLREAVRVLGAFVSVPAKYHKDRGVWCSSECLGKCEECVNEQRRIDAMKDINANPIASAAVEAARNQTKGTQ